MIDVSLVFRYVRKTAYRNRKETVYDYPWFVLLLVIGDFIGTLLTGTPIKTQALNLFL